MDNLQLTRLPIAKTGMLIRRPVEEVFEAIVNPEITSKFWFSRGSGRLETGKQVQGDWESHDVSIQVTAKAIEPNKRVLIEWPGYSGPTQVEWTFAPQADGTTFVSVSESGWSGEGDKLVRYVADFDARLHLDAGGLKALLEHNIRLNLTADRYPKGIEEQQF